MQLARIWTAACVPGYRRLLVSLKKAVA